MPSTHPEAPAAPGAVAAALVSLPYFWFLAARDNFAGISSDGAIYLLQADVLSPYYARDFVLAQHLFADYPFPPFYPLVLALSGGGSHAPLLSSIGSALTMAGATGACVLLACRLGAAPLTAFLLALVVALTPAAGFLVLDVASEPLYLLLTMAGLSALLARPQAHWYTAALLLGLAALTRTIGIAGLAALLVFWWSRTRGREGRGAVVLALALPLAWWIVRYALGGNSGYINLLLEHDIGGAWLLQQPALNLAAMWHYWVRVFDYLGAPYSAWVALGVAIIALPLWLLRLQRLQADAVYLALYLLVLLLWPYPNHSRRFLFVILPVVLAYDVLLVARLHGYLRAPATRFLPAAVIAVVLLVTLPSTLVILQQMVHYADGEHAGAVRSQTWYRYDTAAAAIRASNFEAATVAAFRSVRAHVPAADCISATMPGYVALHARRKSLAPPRADRPLHDLRRHLVSCPWVLMQQAVAYPPAGYGAFYPLERLRDELNVVHVVSADKREQGSAPLVMLARWRSP